MKVLLAAFAALTLTGGSALAQASLGQAVTANGAILCASPFHLEEAHKASLDAKWMREIGCIVASAGLPVTRINSLSSEWQVRVTGTDGSGATLWGWRTAFLATDGRHGFSPPPPPAGSNGTLGPVRKWSCPGSTGYSYAATLPCLGGALSAIQ
jgi:hypothetical protein